MAVVNPPANRMDAIVATIYAPLVLPQLVNSLPPRDYLKYMPKFTGEENVIVRNIVLLSIAMQITKILKMKMFG